ncbi:hypothetical protein F5Y16DRAFT_423311 [Xylariaceae sp. FL0255]|nr:hypothetical protein F5Y16DRAFT_423311 [Xylariaceae sp. FL0255]
MHPLRLQPAFWDNLSEIPLTHNALRELDRRSRKSKLFVPNPAVEYTAGEYGTNNKFESRAAQTRELGISDRNEIHLIKSFARRGGPDLSNLRGCPEPRKPNAIGLALGHRKHDLESESPGPVGTGTTTTEDTGPYDRAFAQHLKDFGIYPCGFESSEVGAHPPANLEEIRQALKQRRPSMSSTSFTEFDFNKARSRVNAINNEIDIMTKVLPILEGECDPRFSCGRIPFRNLKPLTDGSLTPGHPDWYHGAIPGRLDRQILQEISRLVVPSPRERTPILPNFFLAMKGPRGRFDVIDLQANYDGVLGARAMQSLQSYRSTPVFDKNAYTLTSTFLSGILTIYAIHPQPATRPDGRCIYIMTLVDVQILYLNAEGFRAGVSAYRNARDWAVRRRNEAITQANERIAQIRATSLQFSRPTAY